MIEQFVSDMSFEGQRYAVIVRAPVSSGIISAVHLPPLPEGYAFYGAAQIPGQKTVEVFEHSIPLFTADEIEYKEQAVGILTGDNEATLEALRKDITIELEPIPEDSFEAGRTHTLFDYPIIAREDRTAGNIDSIFETAPSTVFSSLKIASQYAARSEPFSAVTVFREDGLDVYVPTQWPFHVRTAVAKATGLTEEAVVVHPTQTGETFNELLWFPSLLACQCAVAAVLQRNTVSLNLSAEESRTAAPKTPEMIIEHKSALSDTYSIDAMQISIIVNAGTCCPLIGNILKQMTAAALGPYTVPNYRIEVRASKTADGLIDILEGWGDYYISNALENHINKIIQDYNLSPAEWRIKNMPDDYSAVFSNLFELLTGKSDFICKYAAYNVFNRGKTDKRDGRWRGIGLAAGFQYSGCAANFTYTAELTLDVHNRLSIKAEPAEDDLKKVIRKLAAKKLEIAESDITFAGLTTADMNESGPATAGNTAGIVLPLIEQCLSDLQEQRFRNPLPISISRSTHTPQPDTPQPDVSSAENETGKNSVPFIAKTPAACIIELEMDTVCYKIQIRKVWFACHPGKIYEKKQILNYLRKNIAAALSRTAQEALPSAEIDDTPLPYSEYRMILPNEMPPLSVDIPERGRSMSAFDSSALNILPAAYLAALNQILLRVPARINTLPIRREQLFKALTGKK
ncbi:MULTISPECIES: molybdopterin cofactor-binding domain-containing protein [unclassified Treponema]|uniref:molybdopterin cofactor-binding domain-containing protein n=1 Tax=unclassified Treponema TaxID=2638727 RepID=UPI000530129F|nr:MULTISPECIES: molybdopterin cofactor-binding domain-containing protein [unclassified Treponema]AIW90184.1 xanthine dehydrogenase [Treponema sp. OMZ 838]UTC49771.1 xanthine dehydrogenase family protein molybdopterin-binding subunit [Treponema sp. OMZ 855]